ncbi:sulfatase-like hydrolase/transferase [Halomonas sp. WWR20]
MLIPRGTLRWCALTYIGVCLGHALVISVPLHWWWSLPVIALWLALAGKFRWGHPRQRATSRRVWPWTLLPLALWWVYVYLAASFGNVDLGAVIFHLQAGITESGGTERIIVGILYTLAALVMLSAVTWLVRVDHRWRLWERVLALFLLALNPLLFGLSLRGAAVVGDDNNWLEQRYRKPQVETQPSHPPNLIYLYLESTERTYADRQRFGEAYADLTALGRQGTVIQGIRQLDNTGWTMAGMAASQCGVPLIPAGLVHDNQFEPLDEVLPNVTCLGDILSQRGYQLTFMGGASTRFAGKAKFYKGHGFDTVLGRDELEGQVSPPDYLNDWGLFDDTLLDMAVARIRDLAAQPQPFAFVGLTLAAHPPFGNPAQSCREQQGDFDGEDILYSVKCTGWLARRFVERLAREGLLDNTLVVVASDHLSMRNSAWQQLVVGPRENTFLMLGKGIPEGKVMHRDASMVDVYPTVLEAMGYRLHNHRAGLGVSLLSNSPTLVERYGLEKINDRMRVESALQQHMWKGVN